MPLRNEPLRGVVCAEGDLDDLDRDQRGDDDREHDHHGPRPEPDDTLLRHRPEDRDGGGRLDNELSGR